MGLTDYFRNKAGSKAAATAAKEKKEAPDPVQLPPPQLGMPSGNSSGIVSTVSSTFVDDIKHEVMVNFLFQQQATMMWGNPMDRNSYYTAASVSSSEEGVLLRKTKGYYLACPPELARGTLAEACTALNVQVFEPRELLTVCGCLGAEGVRQVAMTINSRVVKTFLQWSPEAVDVPLLNGLRIQILPTLADLPRARKYQFAAFIADTALLVVWDDDALNIIARAKQIECELMQLVWGVPGTEVEGEAKQARLAKASMEEVVVDEETGELGYRERRPTMLLNTILVALTLTLVFCMLGAGWRQIAIQTAVDGNYLRMAFVALTPIQVFFTLVCFGSLNELHEAELTTNLVLRAGHCRLFGTVLRPRLAADGQLQVLLGETTAENSDPSSTARYHSMPCLQGGSGNRYRPDDKVYQTGHLDL